MPHLTFSLLTYGLLLFSEQPAYTANALTTSTAIAAPAVEICGMPNTAFQNGESLTYKIYYNWNFVWMEAGEVLFTVKETATEYHITAIGTTYPSYEWFYKVRDIYETRLNKQTLLPNSSMRDIKEGGYNYYEKVVYNQAAKTATATYGKTKDQTTQKTYNFGECMHDALSMVYYVRNFDYNKMQQGEQFPARIFIDKEAFELKARYIGKEQGAKLKDLGGKYNVIKIGPEVVAGTIFGDNTNNLMVWASDDANHLPLYIETPLSVGTVKAVLTSYKGLRHPLTAKLK